MSNIRRSIARHYLIWIGALINVAYYLSAWRMKWFDYFFSGSVLHLCCRGLDFYQIPNGAYAFWHGSGLSVTGDSGAPIYGIGFPSGNPNVYHPFFSLLLGSFLILFQPGASFYVWMLVKPLVTIFLVIYFYHNFKDQKYVNFAIFLWLINSTQYIDIEISQFQFPLNAFVLLFLIKLVKDEKSDLVGIYYFLGLIVKPIGLLWVPLLLLKKQYKTMIIGLLLFGAATGAFLINKTGTYYTDNLLDNIIHPNTTGPIQIITLDALLRFSTSLSDETLRLIKNIVLICIVLLSFSKRIHVLIGIYLAIAYYLLFYGLVFEYHYSTLIPILAVCLVVLPEFQTLAARILLTVISLPSVFFILHFFHFAMKDDPFLGPDPTKLGWQLIVLSRVLPIILLIVVVLLPQIKPIYQDMRAVVQRIGAFVGRSKSDVVQ